MLKRNETQRNVGLQTIQQNFERDCSKMCPKKNCNTEIRLQLQREFILGLLVCNSFQFIVFPYTFEFLELDRCSRGWDLWCAALLFVCFSSTVKNMVIWTNSATISFQGLVGSDHRTLMLIGTKMLNFK